MPAADARLPIEAEKHLIASAFHDAQWLSVARRDLDPTHFADPRHQELWAAIRSSAPEAGVADEITLYAELTRTNRADLAGGIAYVNECSSLLLSATPSTLRWQSIVEEAARQRAISKAVTLLGTMAESGAFTSSELAEKAAAISTLAEQRKKGDDGPSRFDIRRMLAFDKDSDPDSVLGNRWLCRGGSCLLVAQTGAGKSALCTQMALSWALGRDAFGIATRRGPLRSLIVQSENDEGDVSESIQGAVRSMNIPHDSQLIDDISDRVLFCREAVRTGEDFGKLLRAMVIAHRADVVFVDPLLGFAGVDLSDQEQASHFLRHIIQPILSETGVMLFSVHHTTKPAKPSDGKGGPASLSDLSYAGAGSAELANWHRAVMVIQKDATAEGQDEQPHYTLRLAKRGGRAGVKDANGDFTRSIPLRHCKIPGVIAWEVRNDSEPTASTLPIAQKYPAKAFGRSDAYEGSHQPF
jgi:archaellum biogenesis ATPase FlaH